MHAVNALIRNTHIESLNLASNMIAEVGLEIIIDNLIKNQHLKSLNLGLAHNSIRKNSFGREGAKSVVSLLLNNHVMERLVFQDNDFGPQGGKIIAAALK